MIQIIALIICLVASIVSVIGTYLAVTEKDLLKAIVFSALQSTAYAFIYYLLMAPDIALVYIPVAVGLYPLLLVIAVKKCGRYEV